MRLGVARHTPLLLGAAVLLLTGCTLNTSGGVRIHDQPISFSDWRQAATREYVAEHYGRQIDEITIEPRIVVLHWTAIGDFDETFETFDSESLPASRSDLGGTEQVNVSSQFLVDRNGAVYRLMPETWMARHTIGLNYSAISVENVGGASGNDDLTRRQIRANIRLVRYLKEKYPSIDYLIGHSEYREFEGHPLWLELDDSYRTKKIDPGDRMMSKVRRAVADLGLMGVGEVRAERTVEEVAAPSDPSK